jgi:SulP family sulfate permease
MVVAIFVASIMVPLAGWDVVAQVNDIAEVPSSLPLPTLPPLSVIPALIVPAFALAFVGLVQGAGVSRNYVNPDGNYPDASGDFVGQGAANIFTGLFQGMPVGGSVSATALVTNAGAKSRFANIFAGITIAVVILLFGTWVGYIALPAIAGLLILIGFRTLKPAQIEMVWKTGRVQQAVMVITFVACLLIPLQYAVLVGVALAILLFVIQQSNQIKVKSWQWEPGNLPIEEDAPEVVPSNEVTILVLYGSEFFATAPLIEENLPSVTDDTHHAVVVLGLRSEQELGSTFLEVLERYATDLHDHRCQLMLAGVSDRMKDQLNQTKIARTIGRENIFSKTEKVGEAAIEAWDAAQKWLAETPEFPEETQEESLPETPDQGDAFPAVKKAGEAVAQVWENAQKWGTEPGEDSDKTSSAEASPEEDKE